MASILGRVGGQILFDHKRYLKDDGIVKVAQIQPRQLADFFQTVDQRVAVYKQAAAGFGNIEVVFKEALNVNSVSASRESMLSCLKTSRRNASHRVVGSW